MINQCFIIAEAGVNHDGSLEKALALVDAAKDTGCDAIKFQTFNTERVITKDADLANYQKSNLDKETQLEMLKRLELTLSDFMIIKQNCDRIGIEFMSTASDEISLKELLFIGIERIKIGSSDIDNKYLMKLSAESGLPVYLSTGMANMKEISRAYNYLINHETCGPITVLQCTSQYPCPNEYINLNVIDTFKSKFKNVGFSDHSSGLIAAVGAVAKGATVIEKHFTLDKTLYGPDHKASLEPDEMKLFVKNIRELTNALGTHKKTVQKCEAFNRTLMRKSLQEDAKGQKYLMRPSLAGTNPWER